MTKVEKHLTSWLIYHRYTTFMFVMILMGILVRYCGKDHLTGDYLSWLSPWYEALSNGGFSYISKNVNCDYSVAYQAFFVLMSFFPGSALHKYKFLSCVADFLLAFASGLFVSTFVGGYKTEQGKKSFALSFGMILMWPSVFLNSAFWTQCDAIYTAFVVLCLLAFYNERYSFSFLFLSIAFAFKLQTVLIFPFLLYDYIIRRRWSILWFLLLPALNALLCLCLGCKPWHFLSTYLLQTTEWPKMTANYPNIWMYLTMKDDVLKTPAICMAMTALGYGLMRLFLTPQKMTIPIERYSVMVWTLWTALMFLPHMHDRYGYLLNILLVLWAIIDRSAWIPTLLVEIATLFCYRFYLLPDSVTYEVPNYMAFLPFLLGWFWITRRVFFTPEQAEEQCLMD